MGLLKCLTAFIYKLTIIPFAAAIRAAHRGDYDLEAMGRRGRDYVVREASREAALSRYRALLEEVCRSGS